MIATTIKRQVLKMRRERGKSREEERAKLVETTDKKHKARN